VSWAPSAQGCSSCWAWRGDDEADCTCLTNKIIHLRIFEDKEGFTNLSLMDTGGPALVVSQFTLWGDDCRKGRRPSFAHAPRPEMTRTLHGHFISLLEAKHVHMETGGFQEIMDASLINDGPVTLMIDSRKAFKKGFQITRHNGG
jgi:D-tyrosyl-tRNA(Tyr) deacylase